jgi:hypothetical protein
MARKKKAIPLAERRALAMRFGCPPGEKITVGCHFCGKPGLIGWCNNVNVRAGVVVRKPSCWVWFEHEIDHIIPESLGGPSTAENLTLSCRRCNRRRHIKSVEAFRALVVA